MLERTLGPDYLRELRAILKEQGKFSFLAQQVGVMIPTNLIHSEKGFAPFLPAQMQLGTSDLPLSVGKTAATPSADMDVSERPYEVSRLGINVAYSNKLVSVDDIYADARDQIMPRIAAGVGYQLDVGKLLPIMQGSGLAADGKDVTVQAIAVGKKWDTVDGTPLDDFEAAIDQIGAGPGLVLTLSSNVASVLQNNDQIQKSFTKGNGNAFLGKKELAAHLEQKLDIEKVIIDRAIYQDGAATATYNAAYKLQDVCFLSRRSNVGIVPYGNADIDFREKYDEDTNVTKVIGDVWLDIVTYDPAHSVAFTDVKTA